MGPWMCAPASACCGALCPGSPGLRTKSRCPASSLCCHVTPRKRPQGFRCSVFPFPGPEPSHAHACPNLTCLSRHHICSGGRASVLSVPATPCCDLPPEQDTPPSWGFSGPGAQLAHLCLFIHAILQPLCGQTQEVLGTGSRVSPAQPGSGWAQGGSQEAAARPCGGLALMPVCPPLPRRPVSLVVQWVDVTRLEKNATLLFPESIRVDTRDQELFFSMFLNIGETFKLMEQLANLAVRQLLDSEGFLEEKAPPRPPPRPHRNISALKRCVGRPRGPARHPAWEGPLRVAAAVLQAAAGAGAGPRDRVTRPAPPPPREPGRPPRVPLRERSRLPTQTLAPSGRTLSRDGSRLTRVTGWLSEPLGRKQAGRDWAGPGTVRRGRPPGPAQAAGRSPGAGRGMFTRIGPRRARLTPS